MSKLIHILLLVVSNAFIVKPRIILPRNTIIRKYAPRFGEDYSFSELIKKIDGKQINNIFLIERSNDILAIDKSNVNHVVKSTSDLTTILYDKIYHAGINFEVVKSGSNVLTNIGALVGNIIFPLIILYFLFSSARMLQSNPMGGIMSNNQNGNNNMEVVTQTNVTFSYVAGCDEVKEEVMEVVDFIKDSKVYTDIGAKLPKGILLNGPPGTGKTLLARAVAGETNSTFVSISGSQFTELFVGLGASRVRQLFKTAKENKPCIIFIDEIDAIGKKRQSGANFGNDEREQTLNELLTNMDGFDKNDEIVVIGATNRIDSLDDALLRSGRFDRKIYVPLPDKPAREEIAKIHFNNKPLSSDVNLTSVAEITVGFSGADFANLANEAAIQCIRKNRTEIDSSSIEEAYEKILVGLEPKKETRDIETLRSIAYHELGHALLVVHFEEFFDLRKVSIKGTKSGTGGVTLFIPRDKYTYLPTKKYMLARMIVALGGRAAEIVMNECLDDKIGKSTNGYFNDFNDLDISTGAYQDIKEVKRLANEYVKEYGFGDAIYPINDGWESDNTKEDIDSYIVNLIDFALYTAKDILKNQIEYIYELTEILLEKKEIDMRNMTIVKK